MPHVEVVIGGRPYRLACEPGEEAHLDALARYVDGKIGEISGAFGEIVDSRIVVMAALSVADALFDVRRVSEAEAKRAEELLKDAETRVREADARVAALEHALAETATRIEALTDSLIGET